MKSIYTICLLAAVALASCTPEGLVLDSGYDYHARFTAYKSFAFIDLENIDMSVDEQAIIRNTVYKRMSSMGYKYDQQNPDILISYRYFSEPTELTGFCQVNLETWIKESEYVEDKTSLLESKDTQKRKIPLPSGAFILSFMDYQEGRMIWQGYLGQSYRWRHPREIEASLLMVMDDYKVLAYNN